MTTPVLAAPAVPPTEPALPSATRLAIGDTLPLAAAVLPFGLAIGATIADSELWAPGALAGALLLMAGASQLAVVGLLNSAFPPFFAFSCRFSTYLWKKVGATPQSILI